MICYSGVFLKNGAHTQIIIKLKFLEITTQLLVGIYLFTFIFLGSTLTVLHDGYVDLD